MESLAADMKCVGARSEELRAEVANMKCVGVRNEELRAEMVIVIRLGIRLTAAEKVFQFLGCSVNRNRHAIPFLPSMTDLGKLWRPMRPRENRGCIIIGCQGLVLSVGVLLDCMLLLHGLGCCCRLRGSLNSPAHNKTIPKTQPT